MTNIIQLQEQLRSLPDDHLVREMQMPSGTTPQYLVLTEIQRRQTLRTAMPGQPSTTSVAQDMSQQLMGAQPQGEQAPNQPGNLQMGGNVPSQQMPPTQGFADGGSVGDDGFDLGSLFGGVVPMIFNGIKDHGILGGGIMGLMDSLMKKKKPAPVLGDPLTAQQGVPTQQNAQPVGYADAQGGAPVGMDPTEWMRYLSDYLGHGEPKNTAKASAPPDLAAVGRDKKLADYYSAGEADRDEVVNRFLGKESQGGKDLNSVASNGAYIGPGQMNADSYNDGMKWYLKHHPAAAGKLVPWQSEWTGSQEGQRPKGYPNKEQWRMVMNGYAGMIQDHLKGMGHPTDAPHVYANWNLGMGNYDKVVANPNTPIKDLLGGKQIAQNSFDPNWTAKDLMRRYRADTGAAYSPPAHEVKQTGHGNFYHPIEDGEYPEWMMSAQASAPEEEMGNMLQGVAEQSGGGGNPALALQLIQQMGAKPQAAPIPDALLNRMDPRNAADFRRLQSTPAPQNPLQAGIGQALQTALSARQKQAPRRPVAPQVSEDDALNNAEAAKQAEFSKLLKSIDEGSYASGGVVGYADGDKGNPVPESNKVMVVDGKVYRMRPDFKWQDEQGNVYTTPPQTKMWSPVDMLGELKNNGKPGNVLDIPGKMYNGLIEADRGLINATTGDRDNDWNNASDWEVQARKHFNVKPTSESRVGRFGERLASGLAGLVDTGFQRTNEALGMPSSIFESVFGKSSPEESFISPGTSMDEMTNLNRWALRQTGKRLPDDTAPYPQKPAAPAAPAPEPSAAPDPTLTGANPEGLGKYMDMIRAQERNNPFYQKVDDLEKKLRGDPESDRWRAIADFGGKLASGSSPYFAQNFGPATQTGIASITAADKEANDVTSKMAYLRATQGQDWSATERNNLSAGVNMYESDVAYRRAIAVAEIQAKKAASAAQLRGATPDQAYVTAYAEMVQKLVEQGMPEEKARQIASERLAVGSSSANANGVFKYQAGAADGAGGYAANISDK